MSFDYNDQSGHFELGEGKYQQFCWDNYPNLKT